MPQQPVASIQNKFTKGLVTEYSGLSFPEDAATDCDNTEFTIIGNVTRRLGIDQEVNGDFIEPGTPGAKTTHVWKNAGGDGETQLLVVQSGQSLLFFRISTATATNPLSTQLLFGQTQGINGFTAVGGTFDPTLECQFTDGNGYLFVYHPDCDPFYCSYNAGVITPKAITVNIRDFTGIPEPGVPVNSRPNGLTPEHAYNLSNQGWISASPWEAISSTNLGPSVTTIPFTVQAGLVGVDNGQQVLIYYTGPTNPLIQHGLCMAGTVVGYSGTSLSVNVVSLYNAPNGNGAGWLIVPYNIAYLNTWFTDIGNYPSNADVWWYFKDSTDTFNPTATINNVTLSVGPAPGGHFILNAFNQLRSAASGQTVTDTTTTARPKTGVWFQGRVWYTGVDSQFPTTGDAAYYSWTENIYFSQVVQTTDDFGSCYQTNDPTSETLFDLLPTDGGVMSIQGIGSIFRLFPYQNGMLIFGANGIKFITGSQGIGFTANDYTITDISDVKCISGTSFVNVNGIPYFWNEDGIYSVQPAKNGGLTVDPITVTTILQFYNKIPLSSKKYARGSYHPIDYTIQWLYKDTEATDSNDRYKFNKILNYVTYNQAFFPYTVDISNVSLNSINYIAGPGGLDTPDPVFKYLCSNNVDYTFADEHDERYKDWGSFLAAIDYSSYFVTGYQIRGQAQKIFFPGYVWMFSNSGTDITTAYKFNSIWDYAINGDSGRWSSVTNVSIPNVNYGIIYKRHKVRGHGLALQFKIQSVSGQNFDIIGWSSSDNVNTGI